MTVLPAIVAMAGLLALTEPGLAADNNTLEELRPSLGNEWQLVKNDRHRQIKTYTKLEDDKRIRSFRVEGPLRGKAETIMRVLLDFDNYRDWYWEVMESRLIRQVSPTEYYIYLVHRAPYGLPNRDVILHAVVEPQSAGKPYVLVKVKAAPDILPAQPGLVRMPAEDMTIKFTPQPNHIFQIEAEGFIDPGGKVPAWDANLIQRNAPYAVTLGLQRMALQERYLQSHTELPFPVYNYDNLP
jgi:hypothetical protein